MSESAEEPVAAAAVVESPEEKRPFLACELCECPLVGPEDILTERVHTWQNEVYAYELELLDVSCNCYSATNPGKNRFDVVRIRPVDSIRASGHPTPEHSWFPGYVWRMAHCRACNHFLGWGFSAQNDSDEGSSDAPLAFFGLIVTNLRQIEITDTEREQIEAKQSDIEDGTAVYHMLLPTLNCILNALTDRAAANNLVPTIALMQQLPHTRSRELINYVFRSAVHSAATSGINADELSPTALSMLRRANVFSEHNAEESEDDDEMSDDEVEVPHDPTIEVPAPEIKSDDGMDHDAARSEDSQLSPERAIVVVEPVEPAEAPSSADVDIGQSNLEGRRDNGSP